jgi:hypothetical protein
MVHSEGGLWDSTWHDRRTSGESLRSYQYREETLARHPLPAQLLVWFRSALQRYAKSA